MKTLNYTCPTITPHWSDTRETHPAVAMAIHAIADSKRTPEMIWEDPTPAEWDHVTMAVQQYVIAGEFEPEEDGRYPWGGETIMLETIR